jgi:hypothetical protein
MAVTSATTSGRLISIPITIRFLPAFSFVIPGRTEGANPESTNKHRVTIWIPGLAATRLVRNDDREA